MKKVTRDVNLNSVQDLLVRIPRACVCFAGEQGPVVYPVRLQWINNRYLIGMPVDTNLPLIDQECVLLVDEGLFYFDLRAVYIRGKTQKVETHPEEGDGIKWFELIPQRIVAWDYGMLREVKDEG